MVTVARRAESPLATLFHISRFHIICIASVTAVAFGWLLDGKLSWLPAAFCALDWFLVNLMNRIADLAEDRLNGIAGTDFVDRHARALTLGSIALLAASFPLAWLAAPALLPWHLAFQLIGLAYNYRVLPWPGGRTRFKETYFWKNSASAVLFVLSTLVFPAALAGFHVPLARAVWLGAWFFPLELTYEVIYDLRDVDGDRAEKVPTFPVVHGVRASHAIVEGLLALSAAILVAGYVVGPLRFRELILICGVVQQALFFELRVKKRVTPGDCVFLTYLGAAQVASYLAWVALGLPLGPG